MPDDFSHLDTVSGAETLLEYAVFNALHFVQLNFCERMCGFGDIFVANFLAELFAKLVGRLWRISFSSEIGIVQVQAKV